MAQQQTEDGEVLTEVNVIPLADLSLVILIILMVLSPMIAQTLLHVNKAEATAALTQPEVTEPETPITVSYAPGALKLNGKIMVSPLDLVRELDILMPKRKDKTVLMTAAPDLQHGEVVILMDLIRRHGATGLTMVKWDPLSTVNNDPAEDPSES